MATFTWLDYSVFVLYLLVTVAIGTMFVRGQRTLSEYFLAGRSTGSVVVSMTILAALFFGISFLAAPAEGYANGPVFYLVNLGFFIATPITTIFVLLLNAPGDFWIEGSYNQAPSSAGPFARLGIAIDGCRRGGGETEFVSYSRE